MAKAVIQVQFSRLFPELETLCRKFGAEEVAKEIGKIAARYEKDKALRDYLADYAIQFISLTEYPETPKRTGYVGDDDE